MKNNGGAAFPGGWFQGNNMGTSDRQPFNDGMSLRDYFAAQVMSHMISLSTDSNGGWSDDNVAHGCYKLADAMLRARNEQSD